ncbi:MAG: hypothetical protein ABIK73_06745 [candidate division WOR-3 bacterium]
MMKVLMRVGDGEWVDITRFIEKSSVNVINNRTEEAIGEYVPSDLRLVLLDDGGRYVEFGNRTIKDFVNSLSDEPISVEIYWGDCEPRSLIFSGVVVRQLTEISLSRVVLTVASRFKQLEDVLLRAIRVQHPRREVRRLFSGIMPYEPRVEIPSRYAANGWLDWELAERVKLTGLWDVPMTEMVLLELKDRVFDREYIGLVGLGGYVYSVSMADGISQGRVIVEREDCEGIDWTIGPITRIIPCYSYTGHETFKCFYLIQSKYSIRYGNYFVYKFYASRWDYESHKLIITGEFDAEYSRVRILPKSIAFNPRVNFNNPTLFAIGCQNSPNASTYYIWDYHSSSSVKWHIVKELHIGAVDVSSAGVLAVNYHRETEQHNLVCITEEGDIVATRDAYDGDKYRYLRGAETGEDKKALYLPTYYYNYNDFFFVGHNNLYRLQNYLTGNDITKSYLDILPLEFTFFGQGHRRGDGYVEGCVKLETEYRPPQWGGNVVLQPGVYFVRLAGAYPYFYFQSDIPIVSSVKDVEDVRSVMFWDEGERAYLGIVLVREKVADKGYDVFSGYRLSRYITPKVFEEEDNEISARNFLGEVAKAFGCYLVSTGSWQIYGNGIFSKFVQWQMPARFLINDEVILKNSVMSHCIRYSGVVVNTRDGGQVVLGNKTTSNVISVSGRYITYAWARIIAKDLYEMYCRRYCRVWRVYLPVNENTQVIDLTTGDRVGVSKLIGQVCVPVYFESAKLGVGRVKCIVVASEFRESDMTIELELEELPEEGVLQQFREATATPPNAQITMIDYGTLWGYEENPDEQITGIHPVDWTGEYGLWRGYLTGNDRYYEPRPSDKFDVYWELNEDGDLTPRSI